MMWAPDKFSLGLLMLLAFAVGGCDRMLAPRRVQLVKDADKKSAQGDLQRAVNLYEAALDDSPRCAEIHYKLALLYDDKMNDPLDALHHFKRYLTLSPSGPHANDVKNLVKRDEIALLTSLSGDSLLTRGEAARLRTENFNLRKQLEERVARSSSTSDKTSSPEPNPTGAATGRSNGRTYVVQPGDTLASISKKFYKSRAHWKEILKANRKSIEDPRKLEAGQRLIIP
jgi:LysM repeat protein